MKKLLTCIAAALMAAALTATTICAAASYSSFPDASGHWASKYLQRAVENGTLTGSHGKLQPDGKLSGAQMTAIITRDCGLNMWTKAYPGIASNEWYYNAAGAAYSVGLLPSDGSVSMKGNVTRAQVFEILAEAYMGLDPYADYTDHGKQQEATDQFDVQELSGSAGSEATGAQEQPSDSTSVESGDADKGSDSSADSSMPPETSDPTAGTDEAGTEQPEEPEQPEEQKSVLSRFSDASSLEGKQRAAAELLVEAGIVNGDDDGRLNPAESISRAEFVTMLYRIKDSGKAQTIKYDESYSDLAGIRITVTGSDVKAGGTLKAQASISGIPASGITFSAQWHLDGKPAPGYYAANKTYANGAQSSLTWNPTYTLNMQLYKRVGFELVYSSGGRTAHIYDEKTIDITNYPQTHYITYADGTAPTKIFDTIQSSYKGNYKSSYNPDYLDITKQNFVNGKGYSSNTQYLVWANLATQKVNVFQGSKGNWKLIKVFRCASGASSTPTPQGVTYVTYKQAAWKTNKYVCKPIVRFYPNTGYAFHSILYKADESGILDGSIGFPVSHGCLRMKPESIQWIYDNIPTKTTVVIY